MIGIFDSGVGGTSIWQQIHDLLPNENTIYLADSKNAPYGEKSKDEIIKLSCKNTEILLNEKSKIIVVACNTATTNAIKELRAKYNNIPFIGIEPAIKPAALNSKTKKIGVLATQGTINSELFYKSTSSFSNIEFIEQIGYRLVQLIESGNMYSKEMTNLLHKYLDPMIEQNIDFLVLGCTHYPYLIPQIESILPKHIQIIDSGKAVARQTKNILQQNQLLSKNTQKAKAMFYTNSEKKVLQDLVGKEFEVFYKDF